VIGQIESSPCRLYPTTALKIQDTLDVWVAAQTKGSIPFLVFNSNRIQKRTLSTKWVLRGEDTHIWVVPLMPPKMGLPYKFSVGSQYCTIEDPFWVWVPLWVLCWG
jgi:hypothetical protein